MKKLILLLLFIPLVSVSQNWNPTPQGLYDAYVIDVEGKSASELYKATNDWIKETFTDAGEVIFSQTENEMVKFQGISGNSPNEIYFNVMVQFRDNKYRVVPQKIQFFPSKVDFDVKYFYKKDGSVKKANGKVLNVAIDFFNAMHQGIDDKLNNKDSDW